MKTAKVVAGVLLLFGVALCCETANAQPPFGPLGVNNGSVVNRIPNNYVFAKFGSVDTGISDEWVQLEIGDYVDSYSGEYYWTSVVATRVRNYPLLGEYLFRTLSCRLPKSPMSYSPMIVTMENTALLIDGEVCFSWGYRCDLEGCVESPFTGTVLVEGMWVGPNYLAESDMEVSTQIKSTGEKIRSKCKKVEGTGGMSGGGVTWRNSFYPFFPSGTSGDPAGYYDVGDGWYWYESCKIVNK